MTYTTLLITIIPFFIGLSGLLWNIKKKNNLEFIWFVNWSIAFLCFVLLLGSPDLGLAKTNQDVEKIAKACLVFILIFFIFSIMMKWLMFSKLMSPFTLKASMSFKSLLFITIFFSIITQGTIVFTTHASSYPVTKDIWKSMLWVALSLGFLTILLSFFWSLFYKIDQPSDDMAIPLPKNKALSRNQHIGLFLKRRINEDFTYLNNTNWKKRIQTYIKEVKQLSNKVKNHKDLYRDFLSNKTTNKKRDEIIVTPKKPNKVIEFLKFKNNEITSKHDKKHNMKWLLQNLETDLKTKSKSEIRECKQLLLFLKSYWIFLHKEFEFSIYHYLNPTNIHKPNIVQRSLNRRGKRGIRVNAHYISSKALKEIFTKDRKDLLLDLLAIMNNQPNIRKINSDFNKEISSYSTSIEELFHNEFYPLLDIIKKEIESIVMNNDFEIIKFQVPKDLLLVALNEIEDLSQEKKIWFEYLINSKET